MSAGEQDPFDSIIHGEVASADDIAVIDGFALKLIDTIPSETIKRYSYIAPDTDAIVRVDTTFCEELEVNGTFASVCIGRDSRPGWAFSLTFNPADQLSSLYYPGEQTDIQDASVVADDLLAARILDPQTETIVGHLRTVLESLKDVEAMTSLSRVGTEQDRHVAELIREAVSVLTGNKSVQVKEYGLELPDGRMLTIIEHKPQGYDDVELEAFEAPLLEVIVQDHDENISHRYGKTNSGSFYEVTKNDDVENVENEPESDEDTNVHDLFSDFLDELYDDSLTKDGAQLFVDALIDATLSDMDELGSAEDESSGSWTYPDLMFWFDHEKFFVDGNLSVESIVKESLNALNEACEYELPGLCPGGYPPQPTYAHSDNRLRRVDKFLKEQVVSSLKDRDSRGNVFDVHIACQQVLDSLESVNHPIAQIIDTLYDEYNDIMDENTLQYVITDMIKQTQGKQLRALYRERITQWRLGAFAVID